MDRSWLFAALLTPALCGAQVSGSFSLDKTTFAPGEPVFLYLTMHNDGKEAVEIDTSDPYSFCSGYQIEIRRDGMANPACFKGFGGSCLSGAVKVAAGASRIERILLNYQNDSRGSLSPAVRLPGSYTIDALRTISYAPPGESYQFPSVEEHSEVHDVLSVQVDDNLRTPPAIYARYVEQLGSKDEQVRREAARTLATLAPPALEPLLIGFASSKDPTLKQFAPLALTNLATKASLSALAELMANSEPGTYEFISAAEGLGKTHDASWLPLLLTTADRNGAMYLSYAAESGGETAIPALTARLRSADSNTRGAAIWALGQTGSRAAVPILIGLLTPHGGEQSAEGKNESIDANAALRQLTHLAAEQGEDGASIPSWHRRWEVWWQSSGRDAPIYKPEDCVEDKPLP